MRRGIRAVAAGLVFFFLAAPMVWAQAENANPQKKTGILLVAFGTSVPEAQKALDNIDEKMRAAFPEIPVRWAYTSSMIRKKLTKEGKTLDSPETALSQMMEEGFTHVAVQSLHIIAGEEYHELVRNAELFGRMAGGFERIEVGLPLLGDHYDMEAVAGVILGRIPGDRTASESVILMGHGTEHPANAAYPALMHYLQQKDFNVFVGTVESYPTIQDIMKMLAPKGVQKVYLMPLMAVAGDHARNDMAGDGPDSWKSVLAGARIDAVPILKGLGEYDEIVNIWIDHLREVVKRL